jgi:hypothetical protein
MWSSLFRHKKKGIKHLGESTGEKVINSDDFSIATSIEYALEQFETFN